jgi:predicted Zn-dependent peptidase
MKFIFILLVIIQGSLMATTLKYIKIKDLKIPVVYEEQTSLPTLSLQLVFQNSGYIQDKNKSGLASLSAKLLNEGTKKLGSTNFAQKLEENAISINASNGFETFVIELSSLKDVSSKSVKLLGSLLKDPNYKKSTLDKIKTLQVSSLKRKENDFDYTSKNLLKSVLFKGTELENPSSGTVKSISGIELEDINTFIDKNLNLNNLIIVAGGDFKFKEFEKLISPLLKNMKKGKSKKLKQIEFTSKKAKVQVLKDTQQAYIYFGSSYNMQADDEESYKAKVASFILGGSGFGSRLMEEIRVKRGLAYSAYGYVSINKSHSYFTGYLQTKNENAKKAHKLVVDIVDEFVKNGVTQEELDAAKNFLVGSEPLRNETLGQRLNKAFTLYYRGLGFDYSEKQLDKIQKLKLKDLNTFINKHNEINNLSFSIVKK